MDLGEELVVDHVFPLQRGGAQGGVQGGAGARRGIVRNCLDAGVYDEPADEEDVDDDITGLTEDEKNSVYLEKKEERVKLPLPLELVGKAHERGVENALPGSAGLDARARFLVIAAG